MDAEMIADMESARSLCDLLNVQWPSNEDVVWLQLDDREGIFGAVMESKPNIGKTLHENDKLSTLLSQSMLLSSIKKKLLAFGLNYYNVYSSLPNINSLTKVKKWPGSVDKVRKLWIPPTERLEVAIERLIKEVDDLWRDECLMLHGFPISTEGISPYVLYIIGHLFNKVGLVHPRGAFTTVIFYRFRQWNMSCEKLLKQTRTMVKDSVLQESYVSSNANFYESKFYSSLVSMSCIQIKEEVLDILSNIEEAKTSKKYWTIPNDATSKPDDNKHEDECLVKCSSTQCASSKVKNDLQGQKEIFCERIRDELEQLSLYVRQLDLSWPAEEGNIICLDFSDKECPALDMVKKKWKYPSFRDVEVSKFCLRQLLQCQRRLTYILRKGLEVPEEDIRAGSCLSLSLDENIPTCVKSYPWSDMVLEVKTLDFGRELWFNIEDHLVYQVNVLQRILSALDDTWRNECLELRGFPMLSEFNVSIVFILGHLFEKVLLFRPNSKGGVILFHNFQHYPRSIRLYLEKALLESDILSLVPLKNIFSGQFYDCVRSVNNLILKKQCLKILEVLFSDDDEE